MTGIGGPPLMVSAHIHTPTAEAELYCTAPPTLLQGTVLTCKLTDPAEIVFGRWRCSLLHTPLTHCTRAQRGCLGRA